MELMYFKKESKNAPSTDEQLFKDNKKWGQTSTEYSSTSAELPTQNAA
jgi:hypothetical protein